MQSLSLTSNVVILIPAIGERYSQQLCEWMIAAYCENNKLLVHVDEDIHFVLDQYA